MGNSLEDNQYCFRKGRSTIDAINQVVNTSKVAIAGTRWKGGTKEYCLLAALDVKNAFNSARWDAISQALDRLQVPKYLRRIIKSYLSDSFTRLRMGKGAIK
uniref:Reverse transcriptase domain-containing protein n=1 Tax=Bracon brevicornis TaxID=1563983 RepID=A0A6V7LWW6_9HYME